MKNNIKNIKGFTLIEVLVSISVLSIIMVSVMSIFIISGDLNNKTDVTRQLQENVKHIVETISEDVRKYNIAGIDNSLTGNCSNLGTGTGSKLCLNNNTRYRLDNGVILKNNNAISNSWVEVKKLEFIVDKRFQNKVTLKMLIKPASNKGIKRKLVENNEIFFQTTISERLYRDY